MFNIPFPTDSLYKFSFIFGLVLIIFSFYYRDKQLNRFDSKQSYQIIDSLVELEHKAVIDSTTDINLITEAKERIANQYQKKEKVHAMIFAVGGWEKDIDFNKGNPLVSQALKSFLKDTIKLYKDSAAISWDKLLKTISKKDNYDLKHIRLKIDLYNEKLELDGAYVFALLSVGVSLFICGLLLWYYKIQRPQDALLLLQIKQIEKLNIKANADFMDWEDARKQKREKEDELNQPPL